jgi:hypothetical protein
LVIQNAGQGSTNAVTIQSANQANALTLNIPTDANATDTFCLLTLANCGGTAPTLQAAYTNSTGGTTPEILLDSTRGAVDIQNKFSGGVSGAALFNILGKVTGDLTTGAPVLFTVSDTGAVQLKNSANSASAFTISDSTSAQWFNVDTLNGGFKLGNGAYVQVTSGIPVQKLKLTDGHSTINFDSATGSGGIELQGNVWDAAFAGSSIVGTGTIPSASGNGTNALKILRVFSITNGGDTTGTTGQTAGAGAGVSIDTGTGGAATGASGANFGGAGGAFTLQGGTGGAATSGTGGAGADISIKAGNGGNGSTSGGRGGNITLAAGTVGTGGTPTQGKVIVKNAANSTTAFQIQNANGVAVLNADTTNGQLQLGSYNGGTNPVAGSLAFSNTTNANAVTIVAGATASNYTLTLPTSAGSANQCLQNSGTAGILTFASCGGGGGTTLQGAYAASTGGTTPEILLDSTRGGMNIQNANTGGVSGGSLFTVNGSVSGDLTTGAPVLFSVSDTGATKFQNSTDSSTAFQIQSAGGTSIFTADTSSQRIGINNSAPQASLHVGLSGSTTTFTTGFEFGLLSPLTTTSPIGNPWFVDNSGANAHSGSDSAAVTGAYPSDLTITKTLGSAGTVSFWGKSTAAGGGQTFSVDGSVLLTVNSIVGYTYYSYAVSAGTHTFKWSNTFTGYAPTLWNIDDITITNTTANNLSGVFEGAVAINSAAAAAGFLQDINTGTGSGTLWSGIATSSTTDLQGGQLFHQYSTYGFQEATRNTSNASLGQLVFDYRKLSDGSVQTANVLTLQGNGNVGIGTSNPNALLHVATPIGGPYDNGFETGLLTPFTTGGGNPWYIDTTGGNVHTGTYSASVTGASPSDLSVTKTLATGGTVSFWARSYAGGGGQIVIISV